MFYKNRHPLIIKNDKLVYAIAPRVSESITNHEFPEHHFIRLSAEEYRKYNKMTKKQLLEKGEFSETYPKNRKKNAIIIDYVKAKRCIQGSK